MNMGHLIRLKYENSACTHLPGMRSNLHMVRLSESYRSTQSPNGCETAVVDLNCIPPVGSDLILIKVLRRLASTILTGIRVRRIVDGKVKKRGHLKRINIGYPVVECYLPVAMTVDPKTSTSNIAQVML